ncbi:MAG: hypothetical protein RID93_22680, partial [Sandaracinaceae bacterium]
MSEKSKSQNDDMEDDGLAALSALVRPSQAPAPGADEDEDDGKLDLSALAASVAPPPPSEEKHVGDDEEEEDAGHVDLAAGA